MIIAYISFGLLIPTCFYAMNSESNSSRTILEQVIIDLNIINNVAHGQPSAAELEKFRICRHAVRKHTDQVYQNLPRHEKRRDAKSNKEKTFSHQR
jgi:hypothetical protein